MSETDTKTGQMSAADIDEQKEAAAESGRQEERARLVALKGAFPDRIGFAVEQYEAGHTVEQARAALAGVLATELSAANAKVDELSKTNAELSGKLQAFEDGAAGAGQSKTGETGGGGGDGKYDGNWDSRLSDEELAREHLAKNFDGCKEQFDGETGFANYVQFVGEERRIAAGG